MTDFTRAFSPAFVAKAADAWHKVDWVQALFARWVLPGERRNARDLRIGIRNNYLNLYACGQSVAALRCTRTGPVIDASQTYINGQRKSPGRQPSPTVRIPPDQLKPANIDGWIDTGLTFAGDEKRFVEDLVAANQNVIDLEMALSTPSAQPPSRKLSRMDLVVVQIVGGVPQVAFWEAKCANNSELRARGNEIVIHNDGTLEQGPHVAAQLHDYRSKMADRDIARRIGDQYREAATILCKLCDLFDKGAPPVEWTALANCRGEVPVIAVPGLVVGNYIPAGSTCRDDFTRMAFTFEANGHREKLERLYVVECHDSQPLNGTLPTLK